jgi:tRNA-splicing ligase RtcB
MSKSKNRSAGSASAATRPPDFVRVDHARWRIPKSGAMRTDGLVFASDDLARDLRHDPSLQQVANVAHLPGIVGPSMAMPDIHWGYGFPIGGVAAFDTAGGVISPGGVGFDINCGVRLLRSRLTREQVTRQRDELLGALFENIPSGVGAKRTDFKVGAQEIDALLRHGARWVVKKGFGSERDLAFIESGGCLEGARPEEVSQRAKERGASQLGTLGSGNHFCEVGIIDEIYDDEAAAAMGLALEEVTFLIHTGSRGLGYQVCDEALPIMLAASRQYGIDLPDRQLCSAPLILQGRAYIGAMYAANYALAIAS